MIWIRHALFADYVAAGDRGKITIVGLFENVFLPEAALGKAAYGPFYLFLQLECSLAEGSHHKVDIRFVDADGHMVGDRPLSYPVIAFQPTGPGMPLVAKLVTGIVMPFPHYGDYTVEVHVDGKLLDDCPMITVIPTPPQPAK